MLLARAGHRVLLVDKTTFPSDTLSTHFIHPPGVAALARWGILDQLEATNCPPVTGYSFDFGPITLTGTPRAVDGMTVGYGPRRFVLDALLVDAAVAAGAEFRDAFTVKEILIEDGCVTGIRGHSAGGETVTERARVVIGADGKNSLVAKTVQTDQYNEAPPLTPSYYTYWSDLPTDNFENYIRAERDRGWGVLPTHDGLTCVVQGWPMSEFEANRSDIEGAYMKTFDLAPEFAERIRGAKREERFMGIRDLPGYFRKPYGPGWALVGDAGYHKHPLTAYGITDAFRDAEGAAAAIDDSFAERKSYEDAMAGFHQARDEASGPIYGMTCDLATLQPPPPEMLRLFGAIHGNQEATDDFVSVMAGTLPVPDFFAPDNVGRIMAAA
jgi:flavin-dependent dehydrogenase